MDSGTGADIWQIVSAYGSVGAAVFAAVSAIAASVSVCFAFSTMRSDAKARDVSSYLDILTRFQDSERKIANADADAKTYAINEHFNFVEGIAHLCNEKLFGGATAKLSTETLLNHLATFEHNDYARELLEASVTAEDTYEHLKNFYNQNKKEIKARAAARKRAISSS